jgi:CheY-like chemotaxis protein
LSVASYTYLMDTSENTQNKKNLLLVVEDNPLLVGMYKSVFEKAGFNVIFTHDGKSGLEMAKKELPAVVILDILMPGMSGLDVLSELKKDSITKDIRIIMLSVLYQEEIKKKAEELGADGFINKSELKLSEIVDKVVALQKGS